ncbi:sulfate adenylyltransferase subunit 1 [Thermoleophilum album]|uniref:sulfate adenylyltransferase n=1 Tax=Thermoleophilum album TaxID=29539 RepID=A0A1H6FL52_THEAL|nr:GTP-binding protein [Thermoleophilum album]SEH11591.1 sulfate adenylyltransferase subunit 1 [Thermoleophilum album]
MAGAAVNALALDALDPQPVELLRLATAGSVDDGKSTLIGRLLYDAKQIFEDQLEHVVEVSRRRGDGHVNLALLTDGLRAEREQGITIDVAYRYFATPRRKFVLADCPGHEQYTRNMVTGCSTADVAVILVDARRGIVEQSRRHAAIATLLGTPHLIVCVNKMDLVAFDAAVFERIAHEFGELASRLGARDVRFVPISALHGDNVVDRSQRTPWYSGPTLLELLETLPIAADRNLRALRFPVQWVIRPQDDRWHDYRGYAGQVASGIVRVGDEVVVLPSGARSRIAAIETADGALETAYPPLSVTVRLEDDIDVARGDLIAHPSTAPALTRELEATVCWMSEQAATPRARYRLKQTTRSTPARIEAIEHVLDVATLERARDVDRLELNDIAHVRIRTAEPLACDTYRDNRATGAFILIDEQTGETAAAGMVEAVR